MAAPKKDLKLFEDDGDDQVEASFDSVVLPPNTPPIMVKATEFWTSPRGSSASFSIEGPDGPDLELSLQHWINKYEDEGYTGRSENRTGGHAPSSAPQAAPQGAKMFALTDGTQAFTCEQCNSIVKGYENRGTGKTYTTQQLFDNSLKYNQNRLLCYACGQKNKTR